MDMMSLGTAAAAGMAGLLLGAIGAWRIVSQRAEVRHARLVAAAREQLATSTHNVRATNARLQSELDKERIASQQRLTAGMAEQRASVARLEGQLRFAYAEIDRLSAAVGERPDDTSGPTDASGFALTRPYSR
jgi:hypothetical protein